MDASLLVSGIAIVKKELDALDLKIRDIQVACSNTTKAISQARQDGDLLDQEIVKASQLLAENQANYADLKATLDYRMGQWGALVQDEDRLLGQIRSQRVAIMTQTMELEHQAQLFRQDMAVEVSDMRYRHGDFLAHCLRACSLDYSLNALPHLVHNILSCAQGPRDRERHSEAYVRVYQRQGGAWAAEAGQG